MAQQTPANGNLQFLNEEQHKHDDPPIVDMDALTKSSSTNSTGRRPSSADPQKKIKAQNSIIQKLQAQLLTTRDALEESAHNNAELNALLRATMNSPGPERTPLETPGPHRLQPRAPRPEDLEYLEKIQLQQEHEHTNPAPLQPNPTNVLDIVKQLAKAMRDTDKSDTTEPTKFSGEDHHWDEWNFQLRSYLEAKGWLSTYDHPTGPGTPGFDHEINKKL